LTSNGYEIELQGSKLTIVKSQMIII